MAYADIFENWKLVQKDSEKIAFESKSKDSRFIFAKVKDLAKSTTSRMYANALLNRYKGSNLRPIPKIKGWEFSYVTDLPCAVVVEKNHDVMDVIMLCGKATVSDTKELIKIATSQLNK